MFRGHIHAARGLSVTTKLSYLNYESTFHGASCARGLTNDFHNLYRFYVRGINKTSESLVLLVKELNFTTSFLLILTVDEKLAIVREELVSMLRSTVQSTASTRSMR